MGRDQPEKTMIKGSCLCKAVSYEISREPDVINLCHCSMCRKATGSAYGVFAHISLDRFQWLSGEDHIQRFQSSPDNVRAFCRECGSNVPVVNVDEGHVVIPAGSFDDDPQTRPVVQIFAGSKASWHELALQPQSFPEFEPDDFFD